MLSNLFPLAAITPTELNRIIFPVAAILAVTSYDRRKERLGGWLLYFYYWISVFFFVFFLELAQHPAVFFSTTIRPDIHLALIMAVVPRLLAMATLPIVAFLLLSKREWIWVERLRFGLLVTSQCAGISVVIDHYYFPNAVYGNGVSLAGY